MDLKERIRQSVGGTDLEDHPNSDNVAIALCTYFESLPDCPDTEKEDETGWRTWAVNKTDEALARIVDAVMLDVNRFRPIDPEPMRRRSKP